MEVKEGRLEVPFMDADPDRVVVSMCEFKDNLYCATQKGVYILSGGKFKHIEITEYKGEKNED